MPTAGESIREAFFREAEAQAQRMAPVIAALSPGAPFGDLLILLRTHSTPEERNGAARRQAARIAARVCPTEAQRRTLGARAERLKVSLRQLLEQHALAQLLLISDQASHPWRRRRRVQLDGLAYLAARPLDLPIGDFIAWVDQAVQAESRRDHLPPERHHRPQPDDEPSLSILDRLVGDAVEQELRAAIAQGSPAERALAELAERHPDLSETKLAKGLKSSPGAVRVTRSRLRRRLGLDDGRDKRRGRRK